MQSQSFSWRNMTITYSTLVQTAYFLRWNTAAGSSGEECSSLQYHQNWMRNAGKLYTTVSQHWVCVHLNPLEGMDTDGFLLSLRLFISPHEKPLECGIWGNGDSLQKQLAEPSILPNLLHFREVGEREVKHQKVVLRVVLFAVLCTVLFEVQGVPKSKQLG